ncbi:MAG: CCA tRNA nucleotidyltransferase, partial [Lactococcus sp.]|nr:CCA tRNA nucleotidyltransferase [Lactococcus sp.]
RHKKDISVSAGEIMTRFGIKPGPGIGKLYHTIELEIVRGNLINRPEAIFNYVKEKSNDGNND